MLHIKHEITFFNKTPSYRKITKEIENISGLILPCKAVFEETWQVIHLDGFSTIEIKINKQNKEILIAISTHRIYYLEGVLLVALKNLGGITKQRLPFWAAEPYHKMDKKQLKNIPGQPHYKHKWWGTILDVILKQE